MSRFCSETGTCVQDIAPRACLCSPSSPLDPSLCSSPSPRSLQADGGCRARSAEVWIGRGEERLQPWRSEAESMETHPWVSDPPPLALHLSDRLLSVFEFSAQTAADTKQQNRGFPAESVPSNRSTRNDVDVQIFRFILMSKIIFIFNRHLTICPSRSGVWS